MFETIVHQRELIPSNRGFEILTTLSEEESNSKTLSLKLKVPTSRISEALKKIPKEFIRVKRNVLEISPEIKTAILILKNKYPNLNLQEILTPRNVLVLSSLSNSTSSVEEIMLRTNASIATVRRTLSFLQKQHLILQSTRGAYKLYGDGIGVAAFTRLFSKENLENSEFDPETIIK